MKTACTILLLIIQNAFDGNSLTLADENDLLIKETGLLFVSRVCQLTALFNRNVSQPLLSSLKKSMYLKLLSTV